MPNTGSFDPPKNPNPTPVEDDGNATSSNSTSNNGGRSAYDDPHAGTTGPGGRGATSIPKTVRDRQQFYLDRGYTEEAAYHQAKKDVTEGVPDVYDEFSTQILAELEGLESGAIKSGAEKKTLEMGRQLGTAAYAVAKSRRGVAPSAMFSEGQRQSSMISRAGTQQAAAIGKDVREQAGRDKTQFMASKEAEKRGLASQYAAQQQAAEMARMQASQSLFGSFMSFFGSIAAGIIAGGSDERIKTNIDHKAGKHDLMDFLNKLETATYDKHVFGLKRHETGIMAQSAERSKVGRQFVREKDGIKRLDSNFALNPILGSLKLLHDRLGELEKPKKKKRGKK